MFGLDWSFRSASALLHISLWLASRLAHPDTTRFNSTQPNPTRLDSPLGSVNLITLRCLSRSEQQQREATTVLHRQTLAPVLYLFLRCHHHHHLCLWQVPLHQSASMLLPYGDCCCCCCPRLLLPPVHVHCQLQLYQRERWWGNGRGEGSFWAFVCTLRCRRRSSQIPFGQRRAACGFWWALPCSQTRHCWLSAKMSA